MEDPTQKPDYSINQLVFYILVLLTIGEFALAVIAATNIAILLFIIAGFKAVLIIMRYMNFGRLFSGEEERH